MECEHDERLLANALADKFIMGSTGACNLDVCFNYRGLTTMRRYSRTAIVELKNELEPMGTGQEMALQDLTGTLHTTIGEFDQRAFIVRRVDDGLIVSTFMEHEMPSDPDVQHIRAGEWKLMARRKSMEGVASFVGHWMKTGLFAFDDVANTA
jgi:hypothetical protein